MKPALLTGFFMPNTCKICDRHTKTTYDIAPKTIYLCRLCANSITNETSIRRRVVRGKTQIKDPNRIYKVWGSMIRRCNNPRAAGYKNYGGRGISVCREWEESFEQFCKDIVAIPKGMQIDRIDNNGGYNPRNIRIVYASENMRNRRARTKTKRTWTVINRKISENQKVWVVNGRAFKACREAAEFHKVTKRTIRRWCDGAINNSKYIEARKGCSSYPATSRSLS